MTKRVISQGSVPPLVSHSTSTSAPPSIAARSVSKPYSKSSLHAVEEVLGVVDHFFAEAFQVAQAVADHAQIFVGRGLQHFGDVQHRRFADDGHDRRFGIDQRLNVGVVCRIAVLAPGRAERRDLGVLQFQRLDRLEVGGIFRVRARPAALNVGDAEVIEQFGHAQLVGDRKRDAFALRAVAQGRVVDGYTHRSPLKHHAIV